MRVIATSDLHGMLPTIPECELLLIAGDICPYWDHRIDYQRRWLNNEFRDWLDEVPAKDVVAVWGNHDAIGEHPDRVPDLPWHILTDELIEVQGKRIYGLPWQRRFYDWAFNLDEPELDEKYRVIPDCDIIVSHGPPFQMGDLTTSGEHVGNAVFAEVIKTLRPSLAVFGHIHEGRGDCGYFYDLATLAEDCKRDTHVANVTHVDVNYEPIYPPMEFLL
jgi:Icc-related predicted phosphoesterase